MAFLKNNEHKSQEVHLDTKAAQLQKEGIESVSSNSLD